MKRANRRDLVESLLNNHMLRKAHEKLSSTERALFIGFIDENDTLNKDAFEIKINRLFLDRDKPRHWKEICELLSSLNSVVDSKDPAP